MTASTAFRSRRRIFGDDLAPGGAKRGTAPGPLSLDALPIKFPSLDVGGLPSFPPVILRPLWRHVRGLKLMAAREAIEATELELISNATWPAKAPWGDLYALQAVALTLDDDTINAAAAAEQALRHPSTRSFARLAQLVQRFCAWKAGATDVASDSATLGALQATGGLDGGSPNEILIDILDMTLAAAIELSQLRITKAEHLARCALRRAGEAPLMSVSPAGVLGRILYAQGQLHEAEQLLRPYLPYIRSVGTVDCLIETYSVLVGIAAHAGDYATASATLDEACALAEARNWPRLLAAMLAERVRLCEPEQERFAHLCLDQLANLSDRNRPPAQCARSGIARYAHRAQVSAFLKFRTGAPPTEALARLQYDAWLSCDSRALLWVKLAQCQVFWVIGDEDAALSQLVDVLRTIEATGLRQPLIDAGTLLGVMVERLVQDPCLDHGLLAFSICLMEDFGRIIVDHRVPNRSRPGVGGLRLTDRERDVLKMIGDGHTNKVIAQRQGVAPETIKTHVRNIFIKLGVERRAHAVAKAERLGML